MDMHTHLCICIWTHCWDPRAAFAEMHDSEEAISETTTFGVKNCRNFIRSGITTIRDLGCRHAAVFVLKKASETGEILGPRVFAAGKAIAQTGGQGVTVALEVGGVDGVRLLARQNLKAGRVCKQDATTPHLPARDWKILIDPDNFGAKNVIFGVGSWRGPWQG
jgi:hypothetical protein